MARRLPTDEVLRYTMEKRPARVVRRCYTEWRVAHDMPERCDVPACHFHTAPLEWCGKPLRLILDHKNGVNSDNRSTNLRLLCPNCNAQQPTHGGGNAGRVEKAEGGFAHVRDDGLRHYTMPAEPGATVITPGSANLLYSGS